jgi:hypothetical protein
MGFIMPEKPEAVMGYLKRIGKTRAGFSATIEFPEADAEFYHQWFGGYPVDGETRWFAIAAITEEAARAHMVDKTEKTEPKPLPDAERAISGTAVCCKAPPFWRWINETQDYKANINSEEKALEWVRLVTGVESRSEYKTNIFARERWFELSKLYHAWAAQPEDGING